MKNTRTQFHRSFRVKSEEKEDISVLSGKKSLVESERGSYDQKLRWRNEREPAIRRRIHDISSGTSWKKD